MRAALMALAITLAAPSAAQAPAPDPARLAIAERIVASQVPPGSLRRMMDAAMGNATQGMAQQIGQMSVRQLAAVGGASPEALAKLGPGTLGEAMAIIDPAFQQRMDRSMRTMLEAMSPVIAGMEPDYRRAMARAYARRFDARTLAAVETFMRTPEGAAFATAQMDLASDPDVLAAAREIQPKLLEAMPGIMQRVAAATADLPKPRKPEDLSPPERAKLRALLGQGAAK